MVFTELEKVLIEGQWPADTTTPSEMETLVKASIDGEYATVLQSSASRRLLRVAQGFLSGDRLGQSLMLEHDSSPPNEEELLTLLLAVTCLRAFTQLNWTGPDVALRPSQILTSENNSVLDIGDNELNRRCVGELAHGGKPAYHLAKSTAFLIIAKSLLSRQYAHLKSVPWWRLRAESIHQQLLDEVVAVPDDYFADVEILVKELEDGEQDKDLLGRLLLEKGLLRHLLHLDKLAREDLIKAARVMELKYELTGAMGKRTKFQQDDVAQLLLLAESRFRADNPSIPSTSEGTASGLPETLELKDDTLLEKTVYTSSAPADSSSPLSHLDPNSQPALHPLDQCTLLGLCLNIKNTSPQHGLTASQMFPYIARVISHPVNWSVHTMALLLRSRLEANRTRTVERSALQLQALIDQMPTSDSTAQERLAYFWSIGLPSLWEMEREVAKRYTSLGVVKSAMEVFERLEMWEEVVHCWQALERPDKGLQIVRDLLDGKKEEADSIALRGKEAKQKVKPVLDRAREAKLWCLLGELESERAVEHYEKAWEVSGHTSGRAMRSLGGYWFTRGQFDKAIDHLKRATTINPLYSRSWFILGCACLREERLEEARDAFIRCVSIDDEDSESWNNLASAYLRMGFSTQPANPDNKDQEVNATAVPFSNKVLAFRALQHGLKYSYNNWQMWTNLMIVSIDVGELAEACRAMGRVVEERADKGGAECVDIAVLERLVDSVTRSPKGEGEQNAPAPNPNEGLGLYKRVDDLFTRTILPRISTSPRIFRAHARLLVWRGRWSEALEAHETAYRCGVAVDQSVETDLEKWRDAVHDVAEFVDVLRNFGPRASASEEEKQKENGENGENGDSREKKTRSGSWQFRARTVVRTFMGRTKDSFEEEPEWARLTEILDDLKTL